uniref:Uncharacterized protein n=1 Tax=Timema shepardi TaxID=629360 RepID=A0A7R9B0W8_TIMSH|nr:unnamed protein product [Timema shepardi]
MEKESSWLKRDNSKILLLAVCSEYLTYLPVCPTFRRPSRRYRNPLSRDLFGDPDADINKLPRRVLKSFEGTQKETPLTTMAIFKFHSGAHRNETVTTRYNMFRRYRNEPVKGNNSSFSRQNDAVLIIMMTLHRIYEWAPPSGSELTSGLMGLRFKRRWGELEQAVSGGRRRAPWRRLSHGHSKGRYRVAAPSPGLCLGCTGRSGGGEGSQSPYFDARRETHCAAECGEAVIHMLDHDRTTECDALQPTPRGVLRPGKHSEPARKTSDSSDQTFIQYMDELPEYDQPTPPSPPQHIPEYDDEEEPKLSNRRTRFRKRSETLRRLSCETDVPLRRSCEGELSSQHMSPLSFAQRGETKQQMRTSRRYAVVHEMGDTPESAQSLPSPVGPDTYHWREEHRQLGDTAHVKESRPSPSQNHVRFVRNIDFPLETLSSIEYAVLGEPNYNNLMQHLSLPNTPIQEIILSEDSAQRSPVHVRFRKSSDTSLEPSDESVRSTRNTPTYSQRMIQDHHRRQSPVDYRVRFGTGDLDTPPGPLKDHTMHESTKMPQPRQRSHRKHSEPSRVAARSRPKRRAVSVHALVFHEEGGVDDLPPPPAFELLDIVEPSRRPPDSPVMSRNISPSLHVLNRLEEQSLGEFLTKTRTGSHRDLGVNLIWSGLMAKERLRLQQEEEGPRRRNLPTRDVVEETPVRRRSRQTTSDSNGPAPRQSRSPLVMKETPRRSPLVPEEETPDAPQQIHHTTKKLHREKCLDFRDNLYTGWGSPGKQDIELNSGTFGNPALISKYSIAARELIRDKNFSPWKQTSNKQTLNLAGVSPCFFSSLIPSTLGLASVTADDSTEEEKMLLLAAVLDDEEKLGGGVIFTKPALRLFNTEPELRYAHGDLVWFDPGVGYVLPGEVLEFHKAAQVLTVQAVIAGKLDRSHGSWKDYSLTGTAPVEKDTRGVSISHSVTKFLSHAAAPIITVIHSTVLKKRV